MERTVDYQTMINSPHLSGLLPDFLIKEHIGIEPFADYQPRKGVISYGLSHYGYDARLGYSLKVFTNVYQPVVDPKNFDPRSFVEMSVAPVGQHDWAQVEGLRWYQCRHCQKTISNIEAFGGGECGGQGGDNAFMIPPNSFALGQSIEYFKIPRDVSCVVLGKSTYARCGIVTNVTPLEAEWEGHVTIEISNTTPLPAVVYAGEGIMQVLFLRTLADCKVSYKEKGGVYQNQTGITLPRTR